MLGVSVPLEHHKYFKERLPYTHKHIYTHTTNLGLCHVDKTRHFEVRVLVQWQKLNPVESFDHIALLKVQRGDVLWEEEVEFVDEGVSIELCEHRCKCAIEELVHAVRLLQQRLQDHVLHVFVVIHCHCGVLLLLLRVRHRDCLLSTWV